MSTISEPGRSGFDRSAVRLEPWGEGDLPLLKKLLGDPEMTKHLGGPESDEQLVKRQARYERLVKRGNDRMYKIIEQTTGEAVGSVGYWEKTWRGERVYETGWAVLPAFQGRGIAGAATAEAIALAEADGRFRTMHAFPSVDNAPSNALCRKLGFTFVGEYEFEYPEGNLMRCNDWRLDLSASGESSASLRSP